MSLSLKPIRIAIIEDEPDTAEMIAEMMRISGYEVVKYFSSTSALDNLRQEKPAAVILDVMMPDYSGLELLRLMRRLPEFQSLPVIVVSALNFTTDIEAGFAAGATLYLTKPVSYVDLKQAVQQVISSTDQDV
jgi:two-component system OmpR family response regulator